jgi:hypothetical protein
MTCQELASILDERDLDRLPKAERLVAESHLAGCPQCTRDQELHVRLNALPIPPLSAERVSGWRAVALAGAGAGGRQRLRTRVIVVGTLVAIAAAAAMLVPHQNDEEGHPSAVIPMHELQSPFGDPEAAVVNAADTTSGHGHDQDSSTEAIKAAAKLPAPRAAGAFTVLVRPLQIENDHPAAHAMGEEYYGQLLEQLRSIPGLVLVDEEGHADFRLRVTSGYGKVPERFGSHEQWRQNLIAEAARPGGAGLFTQILGFGINPDCGRISPADLANVWSCTPAGMVNRGIQQLRRRVFPPDPATASRLQARFLDTSLAQGVRREALAELIELRQKAPESMDPDLIRAIITDAIANASDPSQRVHLWRALRGQAGSRIVQPMIANLRRETDDSVRLELVSTLAAEFSADPAARAELELIAKRDATMLLRKVAERALSGDAWRDYVVSTVRDASLSAAQRFEPLAWMGETRWTRPADTGMESDLLAVAQKLFDDGDAVALAEVLTRASSGPNRQLSGVLQISMSSLQHPAVADFLIAAVTRQPDFSTFSLLGRHRADPRIEAALREMAASHPEAGVRQLAAAQLQPNEQGESR